MDVAGLHEPQILHGTWRVYMGHKFYRDSEVYTAGDAGSKAQSLTPTRSRVPHLLGLEKKSLQPPKPKPPRADFGFPHPCRRVALAAPESTLLPPPLLPPTALARLLSGSCPSDSTLPPAALAFRCATLARQGRSGLPWRAGVSVSRLPLSLSRVPPPGRR